MNHCTDDDLIDYLHRELGPAADARLHAHLAACGDCRERYDAEIRLSETLRASALAAEREMPAFIRSAVWASIRQAEPTFLERMRAIVTPVVAVPLAAALAFLLYLGVPIVRGNHATGTPMVSALYYLEEHAAAGQENPLADHVTTNATLAFGSAPAGANAPLIDAADAATLDDLVAARH